jgi:hypothetical protein
LGKEEHGTKTPTKGTCPPFTGVQGGHVVYNGTLYEIGVKMVEKVNKIKNIKYIEK